jgi:fructokinase
VPGDPTRFGALETGGTTTRVAVGTADGSLLARDAFPTGAPAGTVARVAVFLAPHRVGALGVAAFGPIDVEKSSPTYGTLLATPKAGWASFPLRGELERALPVRVKVETDVNAAALAEQAAAKLAGIDARTLVYVTVGTGVGVGVALDGEAHHGALHPEGGHLLVARAKGDVLAGLCPFHGDCLEGLASGAAIAARAGVPAERASPSLDVWRIEAEYLAQLVVAIVGFLAPHQIVLGGGVMKTPGLLERVRVRAVELARGYSPLLADAERARSLLVAPRLGDDSGLMGALKLASSRDAEGRR